MPKVRLLVDIDQHKIDDVLEVDDETANAWRSAGKASDYAAERVQAKQAAASGHYTDVVGRGDVAPLTPGASPPGPQAADEDEDEEDSAKSKKGKH